MTKKKGARDLLVAMVATLFATTIAMAQAPQAIPYQAAARNSSGVVLAFKQVGLRFTILDTVSGFQNIVYEETMPATTNAVGLFIVNIGQGSPVTGTFSGISWGATAKMYIKIELDTTGYHANGVNTDYVTIGTQQLMSVPYALYANIAGNGVPPGTIEAFAGPVANIPAGWLPCFGQTVNISDYPNLYNAIGYAWGNPGNGMFTLPYTCGFFLRGQNNGSTWDPDANSRVATAPNGNKGDAVGSLQTDAFASHTHTSNAQVQTDAQQGGQVVGWTINILGSGHPNSITNSYTGGSETRPKNVYVNYMIKL